MSLSNETTLLYNSPEIVDNIRKYFDFDKPGKMEKAVTVLEDWVKMQKHFRKKDFNRHFLEMIIIQSKGSLERAKNKLDQYCTLRTMLPKYFDVKDLNHTLTHNLMYGGILPKLVKDYYRLVIVKVIDKNITRQTVMDYYKFSLMVADYMLREDYFNGIIVIIDYMDVNLSDVLPAINPIDLSEATKLYTDCYGLRLKGFHLVTPSNLINGLVNLVRQFLSPKLVERINVHKDFDSLFKYLPREAFPEEYGGKEKSLKAIRDDWFNLTLSEEHMKYLQEMKNATIDEKLRDKYEFNTKYMGLPGTFRNLSVD